MRVLVTGSREWTDYAVIFEALLGELARTPADEEFVVVHGHCPNGADSWANDWAYGASGTYNNVCVEQHPANWERRCDETCYHKPHLKNGKPYCPMAGPLRNQEMVDLGADVCLAFPLKDSRGTRDCMKRAAKAGIPVINLGED